MELFSALHEAENIRYYLPEKFYPAKICLKRFLNEA
jgi:hypothetical protein